MTSYQRNMLKKAEATLEAYRRTGAMIAAAESCTGGLILGCLTEIAGASDVVERGFIVYSNEAKTELLGVSPELIATNGAVSEAVARAMAHGALSRSRATVAVSATGIAGPGGATEAKPVGLVHLAAVRRDGAIAHVREVFSGDREAIRMAAVEVAIDLLRQLTPASRTEAGR
jgi:nicotinamide-nucleotide amidase